MVKEFQRYKSTDYDIRRKRYLRQNILIGLSILLVLILGYSYTYKMKHRSYQAYKTVSSVTNIGNNCEFISYGNGVIKYSKDGAVAYGKGGKILWNNSYEMNEPIAVVCGKYAVISDRGSRQLCIYNQKGSVGNVATLFDINNVEIASKGVVAVWMYDKDNNYVQLYYMDGTVVSNHDQDSLLVDMIKNIKEYGHLMDIALSKDGKKLAVDFFSITAEKLHSNIGFYNYGEVGQNEANHFMGGFPYVDTIIPKITFLNNDVVCAFKDNGFVLYSMHEIPKLINEITMEREIKSIFCNEKYIGVVLKEEEAIPKQLLLYNLKGRKVLNKKLEFAYDNISFSGNEIIMYNETSCLILNTNGNEKFKYTFGVNIEALYSSNHINKYVLITDSEISEIVLTE